jgi:hypothetical protein
MYIISMADSSALFIVLIIFILCIASFIVSMWTCTGGSWDFDNWEWDSCVKIPGSDPSPSPSPAPAPAPSYNIPDSGGSGSGSQPDLYTSNIKDLYIEKSEHFTDCSSIFDIDESASCYNKDNNGAAVQWFFKDDSITSITSTCQNNIEKIRVLVTSSQIGIDNDQWWYRDLGRSVTHFYFKNAPEGFVTAQGGGTQKITFVIQALDKEEKIMVPEIKEVLIPENQVGDCSNLGVGDGDIWGDTMTKYSLPSPESQTPAELIPKNCEGGEWILDEDYGCQFNGLKVEKDVCGPNCFERFYYGGPNYVPAENGGSCIIEDLIEYSREDCEGTEATVYTQPCELSDWMVSTRVGVDNYPVTKPNDLATGDYCSKQYRENPSDLAGTQLQVRTVLTQPYGNDPDGNEYTCGSIQRQVECNNFLKPIEGDCGWTNVGNPEYTGNCHENSCCNSGKKKVWKQKQVYNINTMHQGEVAEDKKCKNAQGDERDYTYSDGSCPYEGGAACMWVAC